MILSLFAAALPVWACSKDFDNSTVTEFDLNRYLGEWYEIARFDHWFERGMTHTKAIYAMRDDGDIQVVNSGLKGGKIKTSTGRAKATERQGLLRVSFFWPFYGDYRILWLDDDYQLALVGGGDFSYLWILSRTSTIDLSIKNSILSEARRRGYDTDNLIWVEQ